jgi:hypothetical protein
MCTLIRRIPAVAGLIIRLFLHVYLYMVQKVTPVCFPLSFYSDQFFLAGGRPATFRLQGSKAENP